MTAQLTEDQSKAIAESASEPLHFVDPETHAKYVLVPEAEYERLMESTLDPREVYGAVDRIFAEGWSDSKLDDYDRYDELRK